jgi:ATP phosphoribosyltransferase regulatory subunit
VLDDIAQLRSLCQTLKSRYPKQSLYFDLSELRGYEYHTGVVFAAYTNDFGSSIAKGGRYDDIGQHFGRARAATGFDSDLKSLLALSKRKFVTAEKVLAPANDDSELQAFISSLRDQGKQVLTELSGDSVTAQDLGCTEEIVQQNGKWVLNPL